MDGKNKQNFYEILGIDEDADDIEIKSAYHKLAKKYHPDLNKHDPKAQEKFIRIKQAYDTLIDPSEREKYDRKREYISQTDFSDSFGRHEFNHLRELFREIFYKRYGNNGNYDKPPPEGMYV
ncbi:MAG: DnaJ domain-containing protein [Candidatus Lokiarchaeota archaeon]|nr:DnaJ domain-containing protein [Candidatus Lokiarchaeota archaeon]MBD3202098.1 DnaJ domain-containing protein [Candidatus Lokiarchaeota archaeon]